MGWHRNRQAIFFCVCLAFFLSGQSIARSEMEPDGQECCCCLDPSELSFGFFQIDRQGNDCNDRCQPRGVSWEEASSASCFSPCPPAVPWDSDLDPEQ